MPFRNSGEERRGPLNKKLPMQIAIPLTKLGSGSPLGLHAALSPRAACLCLVGKGLAQTGSAGGLTDEESILTKFDFRKRGA